MKKFTNASKYIRSVCKDRFFSKINTLFPAMSPHNIDVFEDYLYITLYNQSIIKLHKFGTDNGTVLLESFHRSSDIMIMHPLKQDSNSKLSKL